MQLFVCTTLLVTSIAGCAATDDDTSEEDAVADAAGAGKADAPNFPLGFYSSFNIDHEDDEPLHAVFHADGSMDFTKFTRDSETRYYSGEFKVYKWRGRDRLRLTDTSGRVVFRGDWSLDDDNDLEFGGETWLQSTPSETNVVNCIAMKVDDTSIFEEGFTEYEYPDFSIVKDGSSYTLDMGSGSLDSSDGPITLTKDTRETLVVAELGDARLEIEIPNAAPRRGIITYSEEATAPQHLMASLVCR